MSFEFGEKNRVVNGIFIKIIGAVFKNHMFDLHWSFSSLAREALLKTIVTPL